ncbi:TCAM1 protein, partial [Urocolius indicus]|nr:TCAM1 protein [Urocolius indicus]
MAHSTELQPSFEDVFHILSQTPQEKLLNLKCRLKDLTLGPSGKLLQSMVLLTLGQEVPARSCLVALGDNPAARYIHHTKLDTARGQEDEEDLQPPQLDAGAMVLLAEIYSALAEENLCSGEAVDKARQAASRAHDTSKGSRGDRLRVIPPQQQDRHSSALSISPGERFQTLRSAEAGFRQPATPSYVLRSSPVPIRRVSELSGPRTLRSWGSPSLPSCLEISVSPTVPISSQPPAQQPVSLSKPPAQQPPVSSPGDRVSPGLQEHGWASRADTQPWQDTAAQVPRLEKVLLVSSCHTAHSISKAQPLATGAIKEPVETSDVSSTEAAEPRAANENTGKKQEEKQLPASLPDSRATGDAGPAHTSTEDSSLPAGIAPSSAAAAISPCSLTPTYSSSTLPSLHGAPSSLPHPPPLHSSPSPAWPPPLQRVPTSEPDAEEQKFFTFVVLHATEDEPVAHRVKQLLEAMGVPNGATLCGDFSVAGRSHLSCFQDAMENSAFIILLLARHFLCNLCVFQTNTALMESILNPSKRDSVIPFVPRENPLQRWDMPRTLSGLIPLDENSPGFSSTVRNTFTSSKIEKRKAMWELMMKTRNLQLYQEQYQASQNSAALNFGSSATGPLPAA